MKTKITFLGMTFFIITFILIYVSINLSKPQETHKTDAIMVKTTVVNEREVSIPVHTSGKLASQSEKKLSFKIGGIIDQIFVDEGQKVGKGQVLAKLDQSEIEAQVTQAKRSYEKAERDFERVKKLYADSVATLEQYQDVKTGLDIARANLEIAEFNFQYSEIRAPQTGRILKRLVEENELIGPGVPVFIFGSTAQNWIVRAGVADRHIIRLQIGDSARVQFDAYPNFSFYGSVSEIAEFADPMSGTFEVEIEISRPEQKLISGFVASIDIFPQQHQRFSMIPIESLVEGEGRKGFVYRLSDEKKFVEKIPVIIDYILANELAVSQGLSTGDIVITDGASYLSDGARVQVKEQ